MSSRLTYPSKTGDDGGEEVTEARRTGGDEESQSGDSRRDGVQEQCLGGGVDRCTDVEAVRGATENDVQGVAERVANAD